jgi:hypothetical protein
MEEKKKKKGCCQEVCCQPTLFPCFSGWLCLSLLSGIGFQYLVGIWNSTSGCFYFHLEYIKDDIFYIYFKKYEKKLFSFKNSILISKIKT